VAGTAQAQDLPSTEPASSASSNAEARFWKLYPTRPRGVLRRRATVSGTSPISTRPPVTFIQVIHEFTNNYFWSLSVLRLRVIVLTQFSSSTG